MILDDLGDPTRSERLREEAFLRRVWKAMMLSPTLEICQALLRGEVVDHRRLDQDWLRRFGMRR